MFYPPSARVGFKQMCPFLSVCSTPSGAQSTKKSWFQAEMYISIIFFKQIYIFRVYSFFIFLFNLLWTWVLILGSISNKFISSPSLSCWVVHNPLGRFALPSLRINFFKCYIFHLHVPLFQCLNLSIQIIINIIFSVPLSGSQPPQEVCASKPPPPHKLLQLFFA